MGEVLLCLSLRTEKALTAWRENFNQNVSSSWLLTFPNIQFFFFTQILKEPVAIRMESFSIA